MPIEVTCSCGRALNLRDELAGKLVRCPACAGTLQVPLPVEEVVEEEDDGVVAEVVTEAVVEDEVVAGPPPLPRAGSRDLLAGPPPLPAARKDEIDVAPPPVRPDRPKEKKKKKKRGSVYSSVYGKDRRDDAVISLDEGWFGTMNGGIIGGSFTLLVGILALTLTLTLIRWRIVYWLVGSIFLIVVGLGAILKAFMEMYQE